MDAELTYVDERFGSGTNTRSEPVRLKLETDRVSVREIIRRRVADEVKTLNGKFLSPSDGRSRSYLVGIPQDSLEAELNRVSTRKHKLLDVEEEFGRALNAFEKRRFLMLVDDRQIESLDEDVSVTNARELTFLHLTPLTGG